MPEDSSGQLGGDVSQLRRRWPLLKQCRRPVLHQQGDAWAGLQGRGEDVFERPDWSSSTLLAS